MKRQSIFINSQSSGSILLLSVLIMSMVVTISLVTATLIIQGISHNRYLSYGTAASYAAESGLEGALYALRKQSLPANQLTGTNLLDNNSKFTIQASTSEAYIMTNLAKDETLPLDLGDFEDLSQTQPITYLCFHWVNQANSRLVANWTSWDQNGQVNPVCNSGEISPLADFQGGGPYNVFWDCEQLGVFSENTGQCTLAPTSSLSYQVKLTALGDDINSLMVIAFSAMPNIVNINGLNNPNQVSIPNRLFVQSTGVYPADATDQARRTMLINGPLHESNAALYDFVLFSQEPIVK
ncbi:MAG: hypothetical protein NTV81_01705 [Candidatus Komeilibacteria bacterium]|nr:hypothetical protein [Candidatus Komeilibacteria bacterium]